MTKQNVLALAERPLRIRWSIIERRYLPSKFNVFIFESLPTAWVEVCRLRSIRDARTYLDGVNHDDAKAPGLFSEGQEFQLRQETIAEH